MINHRLRKVVLPMTIVAIAQIACVEISRPREPQMPERPSSPNATETFEAAVEESVAATLSSASQPRTQKERKGGVIIGKVDLGREGHIARVAPGQQINGRLEYQIWNRDGCPACIDQLVIGIGVDAQDCAYDAIPGVFPGDSAVGQFNLTAPGEEGFYRIYAKKYLEYTCSDAMARYEASPPGSDNLIAIVIVD